MFHSSIIIICGGFATLVDAVAPVVINGDDVRVGAVPAIIVDVSVVVTFLISSLRLSFVVGNVCAANCHFDESVGSPTR